MEPSAVAVVGLGLMGGSLARELAARGQRLLGFDRDPRTVSAARAEGIDAYPLLSADTPLLADVRLLVLAVPVAAALPLLEELLPLLPEGCVVTDVGSTKRAIAAAAERLGIAERFVGGHPLTGDHRAGFSASRRGLFEGARVFLCPTEHTLPAALGLVQALWREVDAHLCETTPEEHDRALAWSSHLPQIASSALALALEAEGFARDELGPGGRDATRLAGSSPEMWSAICQENAEHLEPALLALEGRISELRAALRSGDHGAVHLFLTRASRWAQA
jgi:prephenate dehydrogenase